MKKREKTANESLREGMLGNPYIRFRVNRVENVLLPGMPDINYCSGGREGWIETKAPKEPKRDDTPLFGSNHKISQDQMNWHLDQTQNGGRSFIYIQTDKRRMLISGRLADKINTATIAWLLGASLWSAPRPTKEIDWNRLRLILAGAS